MIIKTYFFSEQRVQANTLYEFLVKVKEKKWCFQGLVSFLSDLDKCGMMFLEYFLRCRYCASNEDAPSSFSKKAGQSGGWESCIFIQAESSILTFKV